VVTTAVIGLASPDAAVRGGGAHGADLLAAVAAMSVVRRY
jgi:hypothetical protein